MPIRLLMTTIGLLALAIVLPLQAQHPKSQDHSKHGTLDERGAKTMGFDQTRATHHFTLAADGGSIEVQAKTAGDHETHMQVTSHLQLIAKQFKEGDFSLPHATHAEDPAGVAAMKALKDRISYTYEGTDHGGRVVIRTSNPEALAAVHAFLRYQIREHKTGDSLEIRRP
jgi:hypothetical protein